MDCLTVDLSGFDFFLYSLAVILPIVLRHTPKNNTVKRYDVSLFVYQEAATIASYNKFALQETRWGDALESLRLPYYEPSQAVKEVARVAPVASIEGDAVPCSSWTLGQLRAFCKERSLRGYSKLSKAGLLEFLGVP